MQLEAIQARVTQRLQELHNPSWNLPPRNKPHDFCADYYHEWAMCYAIGTLKVTKADLDDIERGKLVSQKFSI